MINWKIWTNNDAEFYMGVSRMSMGIKLDDVVNLENWDFKLWWKILQALLKVFLQYISKSFQNISLKIFKSFLSILKAYQKSFERFT